MTERDFAWRRRIRSNPHSNRVYRTVVGVVGTLVTLAGLVMVPFPGPGWLVVFVGVGILGSEFHWARRLRRYGTDRLHSWNQWLQPQPLWVKAVLAGGTAVLVGLFFYGLFLVAGIPGFVPELVAVPLQRLPGL